MIHNKMLLIQLPGFGIQVNSTGFSQAPEYMNRLAKKPFMSFDMDFYVQRSILMNDDKFDYYQDLHHHLLHSRLNSHLLE